MTGGRGNHTTMGQLPCACSTESQPRGRVGWVRTDSASFLSERQRIVSFSGCQADSASSRFVSAQSASRDPPVILPPLHLESGVELLASDAKPPVRRRTDSTIASPQV